MMRSTIDIDEELISRAKKLTGIKTKKELIHYSLQEVIKMKRREHLLSLYGKSPIDLSPQDVERYRSEFGRRRKARKLLDMEGKIELSFTRKGLLQRRRRDLLHGQCTLKNLP